MASFETITQGIGGSAAAVPVTPAQSWYVAITDDVANVLGTVAHPLVVAPGTGDFNVNVDKWGGTLTTLGQKVMASSVPMVVASDQPSSLFALPSPGTAPSYSILTGAQYLSSAPSMTNGQVTPFLTDSSGNLKVNVITGVASNASVSTTGSAVPGSATYVGINVGGNLKGPTGLNLTNAAAAQQVAIVDGSGNQITAFGGGGVQFADAAASGSHPTGNQVMVWSKGTTTEYAATGRLLTNAQPLDVSLVDASGNQVTSFGGGTQYATGSTQATPTGTVALGWDTSAVRAIHTDSNGNQYVIQGTPAGLAAGWLMASDATGDGTLTASWTSATADSTALTYTNGQRYSAVTVHINTTTTITGGVLLFEYSTDAGTTYVPIQGLQVGTTTIATSYTCAANDNKAFQIYLGAASHFRVRLHPQITGTGTVSLDVQGQGMPACPFVTVQGSVAQSGTWTVQQGGAPWSVSQSGTWNVGLSTGSNTIGSVKITDGTTVAAVIAGTTALKTDLSSVAGTATSTAASGVQLVGIADGATGTKIGRQNWNSGGAIALNVGLYDIGQGTGSTAWTSATTVDSTFQPILVGGSCTIQIDQTSTITGGTLIFEASVDNGSNWVPIQGVTVGTGAVVTTYALQASTQVAFTFNTVGFSDGSTNNGLRVRLHPAITGSGTVTLFARQNAQPGPLVSIANPTTSVTATVASVSATGSAVPASADYLGVKVGSNLVGVTGFTVGSSTGAAVAIIDGSGNQITSFGGGTQFADNAASGSTPTGTLSMGWDSANSKVRALKVDASQNLNVNIAAGTATVNQPVAANLNATVVGITVTGGDAVANTALSALAASDEPLVVANFGYNGSTWDRLRTIAAGDAAASTGLLAAGNYGYNGSTYDRLRTAGVGNNVASTGILAIADYGQFEAPFTAPSIITTGNYGPSIGDSLGRDSVSLVSSLQPFIVQKTNATSTGSVTTLNASFGSNNTAGNTIVVVAASGSNGAMSVSDTLGNTYTQAANVSNSTTLQAAIFYATNCKAGANTNVTLACTSSSAALEIYEVNGLWILSNQLGQAISSESQTATLTGSSTSASTAAVTPILPNEIAFTALGVGTANVTFSTFSPYTKDFSGNTGGTQAGLFSFASFSQPLSGLAATSFAATLSGSEPWAAATVFFKTIAIPVQGTVTITGGSGVGVNVHDGAGNSLTSNSSTQSRSLDVNVVSVLGATMTSANALPVIVENSSIAVTIGSTVSTNIGQVGGSSVATAGGGVQKVGVVGNGGAAFDAAITSGAAPANALSVTPAPNTQSAYALSGTLKSAQATAVNIKASAGNLYGFAIVSATNTAGFIQFFNTATTATSGAVWAVPIAALGTVIITPGQFALLNFSTGIAINVASPLNGTTTQITWTGTVMYL